MKVKVSCCSEGASPADCRSMGSAGKWFQHLAMALEVDMTFPSVTVTITACCAVNSQCEGLAGPAIRQ